MSSVFGEIDLYLAGKDWQPPPLSVCWFVPETRG